MSSALHDELLIHPSSIEACGTSGSKRMVRSEAWNPSGVAHGLDYFGEGIVSKRLTTEPDFLSWLLQALEIERVPLWIGRATTPVE